LVGFAERGITRFGTDARRKWNAIGSRARLPTTESLTDGIAEGRLGSWVSVTPPCER
jgi:hypothetical protein